MVFYCDVVEETMSFSVVADREESGGGGSGGGGPTTTNKGEQGDA
jgi:hypothetical protein